MDIIEIVLNQEWDKGEEKEHADCINSFLLVLFTLQLHSRGLGQMHINFIQINFLNISSKMFKKTYWLNFV